MGKGLIGLTWADLVAIVVSVAHEAAEEYNDDHKLTVAEFVELAGDLADAVEKRCAESYQPIFATVRALLYTIAEKMGESTSD